MTIIIGMKEFRQNVGKYEKKVQEGHSLIVARKSRPIFKIEAPEMESWEEIADFTKIRKGGVDINDILKRI